MYSLAIGLDGVEPAAEATLADSFSLIVELWASALAMMCCNARVPALRERYGANTPIVIMYSREFDSLVGSVSSLQHTVPTGMSL